MGRATTTATSTSGSPDGSTVGTSSRADARPLRADAQRNRDQLVQAARAAFTEKGADASLEGIAKRAGVGVGTLYRHFPNRQALLEAVYVEEVEALCRTAVADDLPSWEALTRWFHRFVDYVATKHALVDEMMASVGRDAPVFKACHDAIFTAGEPLLERAKADGTVRSDIDFADVIRLVGGITMMKNASSEDVRRVLDVALDGLRYRPS